MSVVPKFSLRIDSQTVVPVLADEPVTIEIAPDQIPRARLTVPIKSVELQLMTASKLREEES